jgi:sugar lactone lactonase YvrE
LLGVDQEVRRWSGGATVKPVTVTTLEADDGCVVNDCGCDALGRLWLGTIRGDLSKGGHLHRLNGDSGPRIIPMSMANGIGWSPDGRAMYVVDSWERKVLAFAYDISTGTLTPTSESVLVTRAHFTEVEPRFTEAEPDGLSVDEDGGVWVAHNGTKLRKPEGRRTGGAVRRWTPRPDGRGTRSPRGYSLHIWGKNRSTLYVTTMRDPDDDEASPNGGSVFAATIRHRGVEPVEVAYPAGPWP